MKRFLSALLVLFLLAGPVAADQMDLSGMSFDELVALRDQLNLAIWNSQEWQEVTVPVGVWRIGEDIPAGHWTLRLSPMDFPTFDFVYYFSAPDPTGLNPSYDGYVFDQMLVTGEYPEGEDVYARSVDIEMAEGWYFKCGHPVVFTPYAGKPDLGF